MNQSSQKQSGNSVRYSSRIPIFEDSNGSGNQENEEFYRIVAKIRSLEDDVRIIIDENRQI